MGRRMCERGPVGTREQGSRGKGRQAGRMGAGEIQAEYVCGVRAKNKLKETDPRTEKWRSLLGSYHCNAAQCQKRSCVCCRFITFQRH